MHALYRGAIRQVELIKLSGELAVGVSETMDSGRINSSMEFILGSCRRRVCLSLLRLHTGAERLTWLLGMWIMGSSLD